MHSATQEPRSRGAPVCFEPNLWSAYKILEDTEVRFVSWFVVVVDNVHRTGLSPGVGLSKLPDGGHVYDLTAKEAAKSETGTAAEKRAIKGRLMSAWCGACHGGKSIARCEGADPVMIP